MRSVTCDPVLAAELDGVREELHSTGRISVPELNADGRHYFFESSFLSPIITTLGLGRMRLANDFYRRPKAACLCLRLIILARVTGQLDDDSLAIIQQELRPYFIWNNPRSNNSNENRLMIHWLNGCRFNTVGFDELFANAASDNESLRLYFLMIHAGISLSLMAGIGLAAKEMYDSTFYSVVCAVLVGLLLLAACDLLKYRLPQECKESEDVFKQSDLTNQNLREVDLPVELKRVMQILLLRNVSRYARKNIIARNSFYLPIVSDFLSLNIDGHSSQQQFGDNLQIFFGSSGRQARRTRRPAAARRNPPLGTRVRALRVLVAALGKHLSNELQPRRAIRTQGLRMRSRVN